MPPTEDSGFRARIAGLKSELGSAGIEPYLASFEQEVLAREDVLMVGAISVEQAEEQEAILERERLAALMEAAKEQKARLEQVELRERLAKARVQRDMEMRRKEARRIELQRKDAERIRAEEHKMLFRRAEEQLKYKLEMRKAEVTTRFGTLRSEKQEYGGFKGRKWLVDWERTPQPVKLRLDVIRGAKDKIPQGRYVMVVSLYDRLCGSELRWSQLKGQAYNCSTLPVIHEGRYHDAELRFNQSVYIVVPSKVDMAPSMCFTFELFLLKGRHSSVDTVVAWGAFPAFDNKLEPVQGRFLVPLLRGAMDPAVDKYELLEKAIGHDVENWLGNLYFKVAHLSKYADNKKEYEVELQLTSERLGNPDRFDESDEEEDVSKVKVDSFGRLEKRKRAGDGKGAGRGGRGPQAPRKGKRKPGEGGERRGLLDSSSGGGSDDDDEDGFSSLSRVERGGAGVPVAKSIEERRLARHSMKVSAADLSSSEDDEIAGGLHDLKKRANVDADGVSRSRQPKLIDSEVLSMYEQSPARRILQHNDAWVKLQFITRDVLNDVGLKQWRTLDFWVCVLFLLVALWLRMYIHYFGQWVYLYIVKAPFVNFKVRWHIVELTYQADLVPLAFEIGMVCAGIGFNFFFWLGMILVAYLCRKVLGSFPDAYSRWLMVYGAGVWLDWALILLVDLIVHNWKGDTFKLYNRFYADEKNGVGGVFIIIFIDFGFLILMTVVYYNYMLYVHFNGRIFDTYSRLNAPEECFTIPHDFEMSVRELKFICAKAERYRGAKGERRKVAVTEIELRDDVEPDWSEKTIHIGVFTFLPDGSLELHRHFMRLASGAIVEIFGGMSGLQNESRLWLSKDRVRDGSVTGSLAQFLSGNLGRQWDEPSNAAALRSALSEAPLQSLSAPPLLSSDKPPLITSPRRPPPMFLSGGRVIR